VVEEISHESLGISNTKSRSDVSIVELEVTLLERDPKSSIQWEPQGSSHIL
jgi:hypothetical protein